MALNQQRIEILTNFVVRGQKKFLAAEKQMNTFTKKINANNEIISQQQILQKNGIKNARGVISALNSENSEYQKQQNILRKNAGGINKDIGLNKRKLAMTNSIINSERIQKLANASAGQVMRMNQEVLGKYNKEGRKFNTTGARMANRFRMMTHGARGFRMEMLGVMFFGMALQRVFSGLIKTSLEWMGVTEIFSQTLGILFLPIAEVVLEWALKFLNFVLKLTETQKKAIGWFVLVGIAVGTLIFLIGTLALGIGSMILAFNFSSIATIIGDKGIGGMGKAAKNAATKVGNLKTKLGTIAKYAGATVLFGLALKDAAEGEFVAALGDVLMGAGLIVGGPWGIAMGVIGLTLKIFGDEEFAVSIIKKMYRIGEFLHDIIKEAIMSGITMRSFDISNIKGVTNLKDAFQIAAEQISMEDAMNGIGDSVMYPITQINNLRTEQDKLTEQIEAGINVEQYTSEISRIEEKINDLISAYD